MRKQMIGFYDDIQVYGCPRVSFFPQLAAFFFRKEKRGR